MSDSFIVNCPRCNTQNGIWGHIENCGVYLFCGQCNLETPVRPTKDEVLDLWANCYFEQSGFRLK